MYCNILSPTHTHIPRTLETLPMEPYALTDLAQEALPVVSEIATRLGIEHEDPDFAEFGGWLCTLAKVLSSSSISPDQKHYLDENVGSILDHVEKACAVSPWVLERLYQIAWLN